MAQTANGNVVKVVPNKSAEDERQYRLIVLPNQLEVLLVQDDQADRAAAAMDVNVGHFSDPDEVPGLAHFLEHMLFLGTEKYPDENSFTAFLNAHGGGTNAYTSTENTNFHFDITPAHLEPALDRFAQFFVAPLFTAGATDREMNAVDSENSKNLLNDMWRNFQLLRSTSSPSHPFSKFGTGNLQTLKHTPLEKGIDVRQQLLDFHKKYYSANAMKLVIVGKDSLDTLEKWAVEKFAAVKNTGRKTIEFGPQPYGPDNFHTIYQVVPVKDLRNISLQWRTPPSEKLYREKPERLLAHLLGHEAKGSVLSLLKSKGWANALSAGDFHSSNSFSLFGVQVDLSEDGLEHVDEIMQIIYQYIEMIKAAGPAKWQQYWEEERDVAAMNFRFKSREDPSSYASSVAPQMHVAAPADVLTSPSLFEKFDAKLVEEFLNHLTVDGMRVTVVSKTFKGQTDLKEPWYGTEYKRVPIKKELLATLRKPGSNPGLSLPIPNPFIATDFTIKGTKAPANSAPVYPSLVHEDGMMKVWHKLDNTFMKPKTSINVNLTVPVAYSSPRNFILAELFVRLLDDVLNEFTYYANTAALSYQLMIVPSGFRLYFSGYNHKLPVLIEKVMEKLHNLDINPERFALQKDTLQRSLVNFSVEPPNSHASYYMGIATEILRWSHPEKISALPEATPEALRAFIPELLTSAHVELLAIGNTTADEAKAVAKQVASTFKSPLHASQFPELRVTQLSEGHAYYIQRPGLSPQEVNSACACYYQVGPDNVETRTFLDLFAHLASDHVFNELRTKEQLGYIVSGSPFNQRGIMYYRVMVQSSEKSAAYLEQRVEAWLNLFHTKELTEMKDEDFKKNVEAVIADRLEKDRSISQEGSRYFNEIAAHRYQFDRALRDVEVLRTVTKPQLLEWVRANIVVNAPHRRKLTSQVFGKNHKVPAYPKAPESPVQTDSQSSGATPAPVPAVVDQPVAGAPGDVEDQLAPQSDEQSSAQAQQIADMLGELDEVQAAQALEQMMEQALASGAPPQEIQAMAEGVSAIMASRRKPAAPVAPAELAPVPQEDAVVVKIEDFASWKRRMPLFPSMM